MENEFNKTVGYILEQIDNGRLDDGDVYEFVEQGSRILEREDEVPWINEVAELWVSLQEDRNQLEDNERTKLSAFQLGRIYSVMELIRLVQEHQVSERVLREDAHFYAMNSKKAKVFYALRDGKSMTHGELAAKSKCSDSELSQFMSSIKNRNYIVARKIGRTKYYRLSHVGRKLLNYMPAQEEIINRIVVNKSKRVMLKEKYIFPQGYGTYRPQKPLKTYNGIEFDEMISNWTNNIGVNNREEIKYGLLLQR